MNHIHNSHAFFHLFFFLVCDGGVGQGPAYGGYGQSMSSGQSAGEVMEPSQQLSQSTYQSSAASSVGASAGGNAGGSMAGQPQAPGYVGQQATSSTQQQQQQQTFNPNSRFVHYADSAVNSFLCFRTLLFICTRISVLFQSES